MQKRQEKKSNKYVIWSIIGMKDSCLHNLMLNWIIDIANIVLSL